MPRTSRDITRKGGNPGKTVMARPTGLRFARPEDKLHVRAIHVATHRGTGETMCGGVATPPTAAETPGRSLPRRVERRSRPSGAASASDDAGDAGRESPGQAARTVSRK